MTSDLHFQLEFNIDVYKPFIIEHVKFSHLLSNIDCMREHASKLHKLDRDGKYREAGELFLTLLKESDDEGRWQQFRDALKQEEYEHVIKLLNGDIGSENHVEKRKIIELFQQDVARCIDPVELCNHLKGKDVFSDIDEQQIIQLADNHGAIAASLYLLDNIWKKKIRWYEEFLNVLISLDREHVARLIDPDFVDKQLRRSNLEESDMDTLETASGQDVFLPTNDILHCNTFGTSSVNHHHLQRKTETMGQDKSSPELRWSTQKASCIHRDGINNENNEQASSGCDHDLISPSPPLRTIAVPEPPISDATYTCGHEQCETSESPIKTCTSYNCVCCIKTQEEIRNLKSEVHEMKELLNKLVLKKSRQGK